MRKYEGPADVFVYDGKPYKRGDLVPISAESAKHHARAQHGGHRFGAEAQPARPAAAKES